MQPSSLWYLKEQETKGKKKPIVLLASLFEYLHKVLLVVMAIMFPLFLLRINLDHRVNAQNSDTCLDS
jgi:hypothetical protein